MRQVDSEVGRLNLSQQQVGQRFAKAKQMDALQDIVEETLGVGRKVSECTKRQIDAMVIILDNLKDKAEELGI